MIKVRRLNSDGIQLFGKWLEGGEEGIPPAQLVDDPLYTDIAYEVTVDPDAIFGSRYQFGTYLCNQFRDLDFKELLDRENDGLWTWLAVIYFKQLAQKKMQKYWHYIVTHSGPAGSLAYRHAVRTSYELVYIHGEKAIICLGVPMYTWGEMAEQLASRQTLAHNRGFFGTAYDLYVKGSKLIRGASSKPKKPKDREPGDTTGFGSVRRLAIALQRLDLTFDTDIMASAALISVLPKEFNKLRKEK